MRSTKDIIGSMGRIRKKSSYFSIIYFLGELSLVQTGLSGYSKLVRK